MERELGQEKNNEKKELRELEGEIVEKKQERSL
jgi:hypothetical protein